MLTLTTALDRAGRLYGANRAIVDYERTFTWDEHLGRVAKAAGVLQGLGLRRGDRFAVLSRNTFRHCELLHAGYWAGIVPVPVNVRLAPAEIAAILQDAQVKAIAVEDVLLEMLHSDALSSFAPMAFSVSAESSGDGLAQYEALPKSAIGKILKTELRRVYAHANDGD